MADLEKRPLQSVVEMAADEADGEKVTVAELLEIFQDRGFGPMLIALGLLAASPLGAIPTVPSMLGLVVILVSGQLVIGRNHPWLPGRLRRQGFSVRKIESAGKRGQDWLRRADWLVRTRLTWATSTLARRLAALLCVGLAGLMIPLELVPFAVLLPATTILIFGMALTARDGLFMVIAIAMTVLTGTLAHGWLSDLG
ncbi:MULTISPECIES: exopolysaccharide biosynthesis protein [unclassified Minwuia]|uniref:exopolysaccharide biosynthesis protein n=1 Tax=unclassified Minwuia TaxID=2618799 RepID=UPI0024798FD4|nr:MULTISPECIES: exopolysaccharide biosynthesis protein [unclassified Minwuia]